MSLFERTSMKVNLSSTSCVIDAALPFPHRHRLRRGHVLSDAATRAIVAVDFHRAPQHGNMSVPEDDDEAGIP